MVFLCTALYIEAEPFIKQLNLKKDSNLKKFQVFKNDEIVLLITGVGKVKSAIATSYLFSKYEHCERDILINIGICGSKDERCDIGKAFFCNKIIDGDSNKSFYPDMLFKHPFDEKSIETFSKVVNSNDKNIEAELVDMESSGIYEAAIVFFNTHQIFFIKIVSDYLNSKNTNQEKISKMLEENLKTVIKWISEIKYNFSERKNIFLKIEEDAIEDLCNRLKFSTTMRNQFKRIILYYKLQYGDVLTPINKYKEIECKEKNEGKRYYEELKRKLI